MNRKEKELKILDMFNLKVEDKIKLYSTDFDDGSIVVEIVEKDDAFYLQAKDKQVGYNIISSLIEYEWKKHNSVKEMKCNDFVNCYGCPLCDTSGILCPDADCGDMTFEEIYHKVKKDLDEAKSVVFNEEE